MKLLLIVLGILVPLCAQAEPIRIFDQVCVAEQMRKCLGETCPIGELKKPDSNSGYGVVAGPCAPPAGEHGPSPEKFALCERAVQISLAPANCAKTIDPPTAAQLDTFNKNFNDNFIKALDRAFPAKAAETGAAAAPTPPSTPVKP